MKRYIILFIIIFVTILSCSKQSVEMLPGRWIVDYDRTMKAVMNDKIWKDMSDMEKDYFPDILMDTIKGFVMRIDDEDTVFINPCIEVLDEQTFELWDDCMSFPGLEVRVNRYKTIRVMYHDLDWKIQSQVFEGDLSELKINQKKSGDFIG